MDQNWQSTTDMSNNQQVRYVHGQSQHSRNYSGSAQQPQSLIGFSYESYQTPKLPSHPQSLAASPAGTPRARQEFSGDGDIAMDDADPYNKMKYPSRPGHAHRSSTQFLSQEESAAARRYSPMKTLTPSSPYTTSPQQPGHSTYSAYAPQSISARQSPTRTGASGSFQNNSSHAYYASPCMSHVIATISFFGD